MAMKALKSLRQLLEIRNLRAYNASRSLSKAWADAERANEAEAKASAAHDIAAGRTASNPVSAKLNRKGIVSAVKLHEALMRQSVLCSRQADAGILLEQCKYARFAAQERAKQAAADFSRAQKAAVRTEISLETLEKKI
jgi:hypothetical protein